jgi:hypothetical protein
MTCHLSAVKPFLSGTQDVTFESIWEQYIRFSAWAGHGQRPQSPRGPETATERYPFRLIFIVDGWAFDPDRLSRRSRPLEHKRRERSFDTENSVRATCHQTELEYFYRRLECARLSFEVLPSGKSHDYRSIVPYSYKARWVARHIAYPMWGQRKNSALGKLRVAQQSSLVICIHEKQQIKSACKIGRHPEDSAPIADLQRESHR